MTKSMIMLGSLGTLGSIDSYNMFLRCQKSNHLCLPLVLLSLLLNVAHLDTVLPQVSLTAREALTARKGPDAAWKIQRRAHLGRFFLTPSRMKLVGFSITSTSQYLTKSVYYWSIIIIYQLCAPLKYIVHPRSELN